MKLLERLTLPTLFPSMTPSPINRRRSFDHQKNFKKSLKTIASTTGIMILIGIAYALVFAQLHLHAIVNGIIIGGLIGVTSSTAEVFLFARYRKRLSFTTMLMLRSLFYVVMVAVSVFYVIGFHIAWMHSMTFSEALDSPEFKRFIHEGEFFQVVVYALAMSFMINFIRQVNRLLGHNALRMFITGRYHQPIEEERVFMFLDLKSSTTIAEKLGNINYHNFLDDFFHDISSPILESKGSIYQYVGDEVVVTWTKEKGFQDANCIACYFRIAAAIALRSETYEKRYGVVPTFKAGYHVGPVISGEIGDIKREIVYNGDTVNTAARIRTECTTFKKDLLLSGDLLRYLPPIEYLSPEPIGRIRLRGKQEEVELYSILEAA
ncbi:MAG TPA: adenylate/guanylate cyclase domain-containing protein [Bacteroidota bacterium]|nr:adenylate/guanylate cyclase domain-containing protein [Bacteroidota bacterium]